MNKILIEQIINSSLVRYNKLYDLLGKIPSDEICIYIDMYSIVKNLYKDNYEMRIYSTLTSCMVNMAAYYREYFRKQNIKTKIYIVNSTNTPYINNQFYKGYNYEKNALFSSNLVISEMINYNIELLNLICKYIDDVYFINGTFETGVIIDELVQRNKKESSDKYAHMILTKDNYNYQLVTKYNNVIVVRPKKNRGEDLSYFVNRYNAIDTYLIEREVKNRDKSKTIMPELLSLIMTLSSVRERNIKMLCNITSTINIINNAIDNYNIINGYNSDPNLIWDNITNTRKISTSNVEFCNRFKAIDITYQHQIYTTTTECKLLDEALVNLHDIKAMKAINAQYFVENPLDFEKL